MRLVHLALYGGPYTGSFIPMLRAAFREAAAREWECHAVFGPDARDRPWVDDLASEPLSVHFVAPRPLLACLSALNELLEDSERPTILHTHFSGFDVPAAWVALRRRDCHAIWHLHSVFGQGLTDTLSNAARFGTLGRTVRATLCAGPGIAAEARRRLAAHVRVFPNAIQTARFPVRTPQERHDAREQLGLPSEAKVLLHFGWTWELKGGTEFLTAARELLARGMPVVAISVGGAAQAQECAQRLGIGEHVRVLDPLEDVRRLYCAADVFVTPSRDEGGYPPFSLAEALCSGLAAVASPLPGHRLLGDQVQTCVICPRDPMKIADAISHLLIRDPRQAVREAQLAHDWVAQNLDIGSWARRLMAEYRDSIPELARAAA